jgi:hypothetical protein
LRLREEFRQRLVREAEKSGRSFNQEMVHRLEESFRRETAESTMQKAHAFLEDIRAEHGALVKDIGINMEALRKADVAANKAALAAETYIDRKIEALRKAEAGIKK